MTQEDIQLLIKDICARLPYGVMMKVSHLSHPIALDEFVLFTIKTGKEEGTPYLRPLSSMTKKEQRHIWDKYGPSFLVADFEDVGDVSELFNYCQMNISRAPSFVDWLNEHYFDYRGLIEKGLALEAPVDMYRND